MKKIWSLLLSTIIFVACFSLFGCQSTPTKLVELQQYTAMTKDGTTSIEVDYTYVTNGEENVYEFVVENQAFIEEIMTAVFRMELEEYPKNQDINFYYRVMTIHQSEKEYTVYLAEISDGEQRYLCKSQEICSILENYIEENLVK